MSLLEKLEKQELIELLNKNWMTHDAMWFRMCLKEVGIEKTNLINKAAVREMAKIEARRILKVLDVKSVNSMDKLKSFFENSFHLIKADFMKFQGVFNENTLTWATKTCFAHDGIQRLGIIDQYECGIFERLHGWFEELNIDYTFEPKSDGCLMYENGKCTKTFSFEF